MGQRRVVIVGAGLGGLALGARLARAGCRVTVIEKQAEPGGRLGCLEHGDYRFDTGATLYLMPEFFEQTFADLGRRRADYYDLIKVDPNYRLHFADGSTLDLSTDMAALQAELERFEPGAMRGALAFLAEGGRCYDAAVRTFLSRNFRGPFEFFAPKHVPLMFEMRVFQRHYARACRYFRSDKLRQAMTFQTMYLGASPFEALATYLLLQYAELVRGIYLPRGGMYRVTRALARVLQEEGGELRCGATATEIVLQGRRAIGVRLADGAKLEADAVAANADVPYVYDRLLSHPDAAREAQRLKRYQYTSSAVMFYWGLDRRYERELPRHHNIFLSADYRGSFEQIFQQYRAPENPSFYISSPVRTDTGYCPAGKEAWVVLVPVGHLVEGVAADWQQQAAVIRAHVLRRLAAAGMADVAEHIRFEGCYTPCYWSEALNLAKGSAFSLAHGFTQVGYFRPHNRADRFENLYFVGAGTHPGTGLPLVLASARLTAERILRGD